MTPRMNPNSARTFTEHVGGCNSGCDGDNHLLLAPPADAERQVAAVRALLDKYERNGAEWVYLPEIRAALRGDA